MKFEKRQRLVNLKEESQLYVVYKTLTSNITVQVSWIQEKEKVYTILRLIKRNQRSLISISDI